MKPNPKNPNHHPEDQVELLARVNKYHYFVRQAEQARGCATMRNYAREEQQLNALRKKWGSKIVKIDKSNKGHTKKEKAQIDFNPIIKVPIKGV